MEQTMLDLLWQYGYLGIFFFLMLGIVGLPLPDEIMMTFIGYLASVGQLNLALTFVSALSGSMCGITISYWLGKRLGYPFLERYGSRIFITRRRLKRSRLLFRKYGNWVLFFGYFIPGIRHVTAYMAGISRLSVRRFAAYAYGGALTWCTTFIGLGFLVGAHWKKAVVLIHHYGLILLWVVLAASVILFVRHWILQYSHDSVRK
ncbi:DedA family protein [Desmospora profundinema]|uniref:Membrane protein DedA with SNARE-associated domain n=1 Tax=Desmospora profundinema TaxID=1571184 RepID=A0ABU1IJR9_9BACL|nr:DedA family protein [Desmospora profundinema]MDR6225011.1 membrane protein DedA with SNARE-associated domain [Desmospora profundinema]